MLKSGMVCLAYRMGRLRGKGRFDVHILHESGELTNEQWLF